MRLMSNNQTETSGEARAMMARPDRLPRIETGSARMRESERIDLDAEKGCRGEIGKGEQRNDSIVRSVEERVGSVRRGRVNVAGRSES